MTTTLRDQIKTLGRLQEVDNRIDRLRDEERQIPALIEKTQETQKVAAARLEERRAALKALHDDRRAKERDLETHDKRIRDDKTKLMNVKTNVEYTALMKEIEINQKDSDEKATDVLLLMEQIDRAELEVKKAQIQFEEARKKVEADSSVHEKRRAEIPAELAVLQDERATLIKEVESLLVKRYDALRKQKAGIAIVKANSGVCSGCNMSVSPQMINKLHRLEELVFCANCQRILYWEGDVRVNKIAASPTDTSDVQGS